MDKIIIKKIRQVKYATFILAGFGLMSILWFYFYLPDVAYLVKVNPKTTAFMELRRAQAEVKNKQYRLKQTWVNFETIPALLKKAIRITEDSSFYAHKGVD